MRRLTYTAAWLASLGLFLCLTPKAPAGEFAIERTAPGQVMVTWPAQMGAAYILESAPQLPFSGNATPEARRYFLPAKSRYMAWTDAAKDTNRFYRVSKVDTAAPEIVRLEPVADSIAVPSQSPISIWLADETGIDPATIVMLVGSNRPASPPDQRLVFTNSVLTYTPQTNEVLGNFGQSVTIQLAVSDPAGNRHTNRWLYQLEKPVQLGSQIVLVGGSASPTSNLSLLSRSGNVWTYQFTGLSSGLAVGMHLVDGTPEQSYARTILDLHEDRLNRTVTVGTEPAALSRLIKEGTLSSRQFILQGRRSPYLSPPGAIRDFDFSCPLELNRVVYDKSPFGSRARVELLRGSQLNLDAGLGFEANFRNFALQEYQAFFNGKMTLRVEVSVQSDKAQHLEGDLPLLATPIRTSYLAWLGALPVEVEAVLELSLNYQFDLPGSGQFRTGITAEQDILLGQRFERGQWRDLSQSQPANIQPLATDLQADGSFAAQLKVIPKMTIQFYSQPAIVGELDPYVEFGGQANLATRQFSWNLNGGTDASMRCEARVFDDLFAVGGFNRFFLLASRKLVGYASHEATKPEIYLQPLPISRNAGESAAFFIKATGGMPMTCRWLRNGVNLADGERISGSGKPTLSIQKLEPGDAGNYQAIVSNPAGTAVSDLAALIIQTNMSMIPSGYSGLGTDIGWSTNSRPAHSVYLDAFFMDKFEVTKSLWDQVYQWATNNGYGFEHPGLGKGNNHPVHSISRYDAMKWCNARSELEYRQPAYYLLTNGAMVTYKAGAPDPTTNVSIFPKVNWSAGGYRLPTEAEWEKAAAKYPEYSDHPTFPWGYYISHTLANYYSDWKDGHSFYQFDYSTTPGMHPDFNAGEQPFTSPVGSFAPNEYGLYDVVGNIAEMCWDTWDGLSGYTTNTLFKPINPHGPEWTEGTSMYVVRGGHYGSSLPGCLPTFRSFSFAHDTNWFNGFRCALPSPWANTTAPSVPFSSMVYIPMGAFDMGDSLNEGAPDELPVHRVTVGDYFIDPYETTGDQWNSILQHSYATNYDLTSHDFTTIPWPGHYKTNPFPVVVNWYEAIKYCNLKSEIYGFRPFYFSNGALTEVYRSGDNLSISFDKTANGFRLPTEAEWERAARGGLEHNRFPNGDTISHSDANYFSSDDYSYDVSPTRGHNQKCADTCPPGSFFPNKYGLYDMAGNMSEWCHDGYGAYSSENHLDPYGTGSSSRVARGGHYQGKANLCRVSSRTSSPAGSGLHGFRVVLKIK